MIAVGYVRQSESRNNETIDTSLSLDSQEMRIRQYAELRGWTVSKVIRDLDRQGDDPDRPGLRELLDSVTNGTTVIVYDLSRFSRSLILQETKYAEILQKGGTLVSITEPHADNDLMRGILGVINQEQRKQIGRRVSMAREVSARRGRVTAMAPLGYKSVGGVLEIDPERAGAVRYVFSEVASGTPASRVARWLKRNAEFPYSWNHSSITRIVNNPLYSGGTVYKGEAIYPENGGTFHEPIVSIELQQKAKRALESRSVQRTRRDPDPEYPFSEIVFHECGLRCYWQQGRGNPYLMYYCASVADAYQGEPCACKPQRISGFKLNAYAHNCLITDMRMVDLAPTVLFEKGMAMFTHERPFAEIERKRIEQQRSDLQLQETRSIEIVQQGFRSMAWLAQEQERIKTEMAQLDALLAGEPGEPTLADATTIAGIARTISIGDLPLQHEAEILKGIGQIVWGPSGARIEYRDNLRYFLPNPTVIPIEFGRNVKPPELIR